MYVPTIPTISRWSRSHKYSAMGASAASVLVLAVSGLSGNAGTATAAESTSLTSRSASVQQSGVAAQAEAASELALRDAAEREESEQAATRSEERTGLGEREREQPKTLSAPVYADNLDGWIKESLAVMDRHGIPGSYEGIHRNIMRESSGDTRAINLWDINARNGIPSKGLLQVIDPTFRAYHVPGTSWDVYDPVANITAACNYAADRYGTMDNVDSAY